MPSIGDLANDVAKALYEQRIAVAIVSVIALVGIVLVARRFGWLGIARRHPLATGVLTAGALAIALPLGWYLGSPIFIRTSLVEAAPSPVPVVTAAPVPSASEAAVPSATTAPSAAPTATPFAPRALAIGE